MAGPSLKQQIDDLLGKLNPGGIVGLDIGAHSIKVCELSGSPGKIKLERFGVFTLPEAAVIEDELQKTSEITDGIIEALKQANIKSKDQRLAGSSNLMVVIGLTELTHQRKVKDFSAQQISWLNC